MKRINYILPFFVLLLFACNQKTSSEINYIDKTQPSLEPQLFAKGFITKDSVSEFGSIFNRNKNEFYFAVDSAKRALIKYTKYENEKWTEPVTLIPDSKYSFNDPFLSNDESKLYYISDKPRDEMDTINDHDIWYSERLDASWSAPINAGMKINSDAQEYYISFTNNDAIYFASNKGKSKKRQHDFDIYKAEFKEGKYETPQRLSDSINTKRYEADVFISPDESFIIFCSARKTGFGKGDLYISFKNKNGNWTQSINLGEKINTEGHELCPFVTKDGKYLFYTSNQDIYWVSTDIIAELKEKQSIILK